VASIRVGYFLEDVAQESFITTLTERIATRVGFSEDDLKHDPRSAVGGHGTVTSELRRFLLDVRRGIEGIPDLLVVAIDSNCSGCVAKRNEIDHIVQQTEYPGTVVHAIPDPHIERWYVADPDALAVAIEADVYPEVPPHKCERGHYKQVIGQTLSQAGIVAPLGGAEYGPEVANALDLYTVCKADSGFRHFVDELQGALQILSDVID
jgi:hypothetical protein